MLRNIFLHAYAKGRWLSTKKTMKRRRDVKRRRVGNATSRRCENVKAGRRLAET